MAKPFLNFDNKNYTTEPGILFQQFPMCFENKYSLSRLWQKMKGNRRIYEIIKNEVNVCL